MARRKIVWSSRAKISLFKILSFFTERNGNNTYSKKLHFLFQSRLQRLTLKPDLGIITDMKSVRGLIVDEYIIFYEVTSSEIIIHTIWDSRQDPKGMKIK